ncbi:MAG: polysaccharide biosynthesis/export family protein [Flavobacteriales bacterium]|nr:polysaccharide biosynthesis/export family protein [Flavobacteriales bacterium]
MKKLILPVVFALLFSSCGKKLIYFQEHDGTKNKYNNIEVAQPEDTRLHVIEAGDILGLKINTTSKELSDEFKSYLNNATGIPGLLVQENGTIFLPYTGSIKISGKSIKLAQTIIATELSKYIVNPDIELTLNSFRITILGEVKMPGIKNSPGDRMTILDALSLSGDLAIDARRTNIKVIRQIGEKKVTNIMDISSLDIFRSETYYLKSNDIVYIETLPKKIVRDNIAYLTLFLSIVNVLAITLNRFY